MKFSGLLFGLIGFLSFAGSWSDEDFERVEQLRKQALTDEVGYELVSSLTAEIGPRLAGSAADHAAVAWAEKRLKDLGFDKVWTEPVTFPYWERGEAEAIITAPFVPQKMVVTALGGSVGTPDMGVQGDVVRFATFADLKAYDGSLEGRIAYIENRMERTKTGTGYGKAVIARRSGAAEAAKRGAVAVLIRSIGTSDHRFAHTGTMRYKDDIPKIPAAAISNPDADILTKRFEAGETVRISLRMTCRTLGSGRSANVIGEITGRDPKGVVLLGAHLDSWDEGTGAIDDGAGVAIVTAAANIIAKGEKRPRNTIRVVLFANEEGGLHGARAYAQAHQDELDRHLLCAESDFGAGPIWNFATLVGTNVLDDMKHIGKALAPLGVSMGQNNAFGGPDLMPLRRAGVPVVSLYQDGSDYFDYHHTPNDTLDKIDPEALRQNIAAYTVFAWLAAEREGDYGTPPKQRGFEQGK